MEKRNDLLYLASPYTHANKNIVVWRARAATAATAEMINRGYCVFSPIVYTHSIADVMPESHNTLENWLSVDRWFMDLCGVMALLELPGWVDSKGILAEHLYMTTQGKPVMHIDPNELGIYSLVGIPPDLCQEETTLWPKT